MSNAGSLIGVDLGGTKIALVRYNAQTMEVEEELKQGTPTKCLWPTVFADLVTAIEKIRTPETVAVGVGAPGLVRQPEGVLLTMPNLPGAVDITLKKDLEDALDLPVVVENDANTFTFAEALNSKYCTNSVFIGITLGTGVGGGIVIDGTLLRGAHGYAAEIGHMLLKPGEPPYETEDKRGEVEQFFSGTAFGKRCKEAHSPHDYLEGEVCEFMRPDVFREIAWMCVSLTSLLDPSIIVFGGSAGHALAPHFDAVKKEMHAWALPNMPLPELGVAKLNDAATRGAALLAKELVQ